jgi:hypothetical protein
VSGPGVFDVDTVIRWLRLESLTLTAILELTICLALMGAMLAVLLSVFVYYVVATFVSAMYLPIFSLGATI